MNEIAQRCQKWFEKGSPVVDTFEDEAYEVEAEEDNSEHRLKTLFEGGDVENVEMSHDVSQRLIWQFRVRVFPKYLILFQLCYVAVQGDPEKDAVLWRKKLGLGAKYARLYNRHRHP